LKAAELAQCNLESTKSKVEGYGTDLLIVTCVALQVEGLVVALQLGKFKSRGQVEWWPFKSRGQVKWPGRLFKSRGRVKWRLFKSRGHLKST
jgi:hypothetical protein